MKRLMMVRTCCVLLCAVWFVGGCGDGTPGFPGWYKGDLHCHSLYSDGDSTVKELISTAEQAGFNYFVITDHDGDMDGLPAQWYDPDYKSGRLVLLYGTEWTTSMGHANVWASHPLEYGPLWEANRDLNAQLAIDLAHLQGAVFSVNHPSAYLCCPWKFEQYEGIDSVEVWNSMHRLPNFNWFSSNIFWDELLLDGKRITGVGGSDTHQLKGSESKLFGLGDPTTWVFSEGATADAVLAGIKSGRVSVSQHSQGPRLDFVADTDGDAVPDTVMGENVVLGAPSKVTFEIQLHSQSEQGAAEGVLEAEDVTGAAEGISGSATASVGEKLDALLGGARYLAIVIKNGRLHGVWRIKGETGSMQFADNVVPGEQVFYRVELLGKPSGPLLDRLLDGRMKALSNPIYFGYP